MVNYKNVIYYLLTQLYFNVKIDVQLLGLTPVCMSIESLNHMIIVDHYIQELDPVTLHNQALMNMEDNPTQGFEKLQFLLQQNPCPPGVYTIMRRFCTMHLYHYRNFCQFVAAVS